MMRNNDFNNNLITLVPQTAFHLQLKKVVIIGLGQLGFPVAKYMKERGFDTYGYDISTKAMEYAEKTAGIKLMGTDNNNFGSENFDVYEI